MLSFFLCLSVLLSFRCNTALRQCAVSQTNTHTNTHRVVFNGHTKLSARHTHYFTKAQRWNGLFFMMFSPREDQPPLYTQKCPFWHTVTHSAILKYNTVIGNTSVLFGSLKMLFIHPGRWQRERKKTCWALKPFLFFPLVSHMDNEMSAFPLNLWFQLCQERWRGMRQSRPIG